MVSFLSKLAVIATVVTSSVSALEIGEYSRPTGTEVSGVPGASAPYLRSPCPALNALANHGYLPRDGKNIDSAMLEKAIMDVYNIDWLVAKALASQVKGSITLAHLSTHNLVEHDVSLAHSDFSYGSDMAALNVTMWEDLSGRAVDNTIGVSEVAAAREKRIDVCKSKAGGCDFGLKQRILGALEAAVMLRGLGGKNKETISLEYATSFFVDERIPDDYQKPSTAISLANLLSTATKIDLKVTWIDILEFLGM
ncbi:hypothetical protein Poli38472_011556 [Pythium oligandrum]|uniref:Heme haloperoxidase family profile domain-containing protein n=1 Tax=Pythium oligandrum TaxID=41045 RepID=A0A8K1CL22_PYTOL|nr:hypothetical protein Poli38472_011556 [Pythium oligandrum]|eukprot:TMW64676.1 hypothetical protein Poli38472_011556 [Pythium oligandrum]